MRWKRFLLRNRFFAPLVRLARTRQIVCLEYRIDPRPRWGFGRPPHRGLYELLNSRRAGYQETLNSFVAYQQDLASMPLRGHSDEPGWINGYLPGLDTVALYS